MTDNGFRGLKLRNTLSSSKDAEPFLPIDWQKPEIADADKKVRMYVCGPTVYDFAHIGNARPVIVFDVLYRLLRHLYGENHVTYVRNITDVDDKINARALRDFPNLPLNEAIRNVTEKTANQFHEDVKALGCLEPTHEPRATEHIDGMVRIIQQLIDRGHAYVATGGEGREVLFAVGSMADYGQLSKRKLEDQQAGARIAVEAHKRNPGDFVLWKESAADQPGWTGNFRENGKEEIIHGRPGWHIECSAMSQFHLGETFDIHGGGLDLIFPHHENEIAQSRCAHGTDVMANVWMHNGFLQVEGKKMSKSDGNFFTIHELMNTTNFGGRKWPGEVLRLAMLMTHYREPIDFSVRRLEEAKARQEKWLGPLGRRGDPDKGVVFPEVIEAVCDDLDMTSAFMFLEIKIRESIQADPQYMASVEKVRLRNSIASTLVWLGIAKDEDFEAAKSKNAEIRQTLEAAHVGLKKSDIDSQIGQRLAFLAAKDFANADRIRNELLEQGIQLKDGKDADGNRVTTWEVKR